jgi:hypothetical protein
MKNANNNKINLNQQDGGFMDIKPHTLTVMFIGIVFLIGQTFYRKPSENDLIAYAFHFIVHNSLLPSGVAAAATSFLLFSLLQFYDDPYFKRPQPSIRRLMKVQMCE